MSNEAGEALTLFDENTLGETQELAARPKRVRERVETRSGVQLAIGETLVQLKASNGRPYDFVTRSFTATDGVIRAGTVYTEEGERFGWVSLANLRSNSIEEGGVRYLYTSPRDEATQSMRLEEDIVLQICEIVDPDTRYALADEEQRTMMYFFDTLVRYNTFTMLADVKKGTLKHPERSPELGRFISVRESAYNDLTALGFSDNGIKLALKLLKSGYNGYRVLWEAMTAMGETPQILTTEQVKGRSEAAEKRLWP